jgi:hypothetical protein
MTKEYTSANQFPRKLTSVENMLLFSVLPENKSGYNSYRNKINNLVVTGSGRFGEGNFVLGKEGTKPDLSLPSAPVFAIGSNVYEEATVDVTIHEDIDDEIEYDISARNQNSIPETLTEIKKWNYSEWNPGDEAPNDNSQVREIIINDDYILAVAPLHKKIWLHERRSGVNFLLPVTNFYNELMRVCNIRDTKIALKPSSFFNTHNQFTNEQLMLAFFSYNKYLKRVDIDYTFAYETHRKKKKSFLSVFSGKGKK